MIELWMSSAVWAFSFGLIKRFLVGIDPWTMAAARLALSAVTFGGAVWLFGKLKKTPWNQTARERWSLMVIGSVQLGLMYGLYNLSFRYLAAWEVVALTTTTPVFVVVLGALIERRALKRELFAAFVAVLGALVLVVRPQNPASGLSLQPLLGVLLVQLCNLLFALGQVGYRHLKSGSATDTQRMVWVFVGAATASVGLALIRGGWSGVIPLFGLDKSTLGWLVYLGVVPTGVGFWLWNRGARRVSAGVLSVMNNIKVPFGVVVSAGVFGEQVNVLPLLVSGLLFWGSFKILGRRAVVS